MLSLPVAGGGDGASAVIHDAAVAIVLAVVIRYEIPVGARANVYPVPLVARAIIVLHHTVMAKHEIDAVALHIATIGIASITCDSAANR
jgi:hypothetical protein